MNDEANTPSKKMAQYGKKFIQSFTLSFSFCIASLGILYLLLISMQWENFVHKSLARLGVFD